MRISRQSSPLLIMLDQKQLKNVKYFNYLWSQKTNDSRARIDMPKAAFNKKNYYIWSTALYGAQTWTILKVDQKYLGSFEMLCRRRMERISWTDCMKSEVLHTDKEERIIIHTMKQGKENWICHNFHRSYLLKHAIKGELKGMGRQERRSKHLFDDLKDVRQYWNLKQNVLDHTVWRTHFRRGYWPVISQTVWRWCKIEAT